MSFSNYSLDHVSDIIKEISRQKEQILHESLNDLIKTGLLIVEQSAPVLVQSPDQAKYEFKQSFRLVLRDKEHIQALEKENKDLKERLQAITKAIAELETI